MGTTFRNFLDHHFFRHLILVALPVVSLIAVLANSPAVHADTTIYDAFTDFSGVSNPTSGGIWSYGYTNSLGGAFTLYPSVAYRFNAVYRWSPGPTVEDGNVVKNVSGTDIRYPYDTDIVYPASEYLHFHPGPNGENSIVRFTAPINGIYQVNASFKSLRQCCTPTTTDIHVLKNSVSLFDAVINGFITDGTKDFSQSLSLNAGDTIDFAVGYGADQSYGFDSSGIKATITRQSMPSPTPTLTPSQAIQKIVDTAKGFNLQQGIENSLDAKLQDVLDALNAANSGNRQDATNKLQAFINEVQAQRGNKLTNAQADVLIGQAQAVISQLS